MSRRSERHERLRRAHKEWADAPLHGGIPYPPGTLSRDMWELEMAQRRFYNAILEGVLPLARWILKRLA